MSDLVQRSDGQSEERRRSARSALRLSGTLREPGRSRVQVRLIDISCNGCRIEATSNATVDSWVLLTIGGLQTQYCRVVWQSHEFAGLEFATPLAEAVLETLLQEQDRLSESVVRELREIANRAHRLSTRQRNGQDQQLAELSHKCAVDALVEGLRLGDTQNSSSGRGLK